MTDEERMLQQNSRGVAADKALETVGEAFKAAKAKYVEAWMASDPRDTAGREKLWVATTIVSLVESQLRQWTIDGTVAAKELEKIRNAGKPKEILPRIFRGNF